MPISGQKFMPNIRQTRFPCSGAPVRKYHPLPLDFQFCAYRERASGFSVAGSKVIVKRIRSLPIRSGNRFAISPRLLERRKQYSEKEHLVYTKEIATTFPDQSENLTWRPYWSTKLNSGTF